MPEYHDDREVTYEIVEEIGIISTQSTGWTRELNVVAWNGGQGKYDLREWSPQHDRMSRGITLNEQEMRALLELMRRRSRLSSRRGSGERSYHSGPIRTFSGSEPAAREPEPVEPEPFEAEAAETMADMPEGLSEEVDVEEGGDEEFAKELVS